jgi:hypothetical protein
MVGLALISLWRPGWSVATARRSRGTCFCSDPMSAIARITEEGTTDGKKLLANEYLA